MATPAIPAFEQQYGRKKNKEKYTNEVIYHLVKTEIYLEGLGLSKKGNMNFTDFVYWLY